MIPARYRRHGRRSRISRAFAGVPNAVGRGFFLKKDGACEKNFLKKNYKIKQVVTIKYIFHTLKRWHFSLFFALQKMFAKFRNIMK